MVFQINVPVGPAKEGETAPRRYYKYKDQAISRPVGYRCNTVYEYMLECIKTHGKDRKCMGSRDLIDLHSEKKIVKKMIDGTLQEQEKEWIYYEKSDYSYITFGDLENITTNFGKGLVKLGVKPAEEKLHIFAATSAKWLQTFLSAQSQSIPVVTAYDTLGEEGLTISLCQTETVGVFTNNDLLAKLINPLKKAEKVRYIIHSESLNPNDKILNGKLYKDTISAIEKIKEIRPDIKIISYEDVIQLGKENAKEIDVHPPKADDLACIMYTSGSTGTPKGVTLTHKNIVGGLGGISSVIDRQKVGQNDRIICFLPLAHIFELAFELIVLYWGGVIGYASVKTLSDVSMRNSEGDMKTFKPTIMVGVAAVWEAVRKGILGQIDKLPATKQKVFWSCYRAKLLMKKYYIPGTSIIDNLIFKKVKEATGGNLKLLLNGGSPISGSTQRFITTLIAPMLIGYGLTETVANTCITDPDYFEYDCPGTLVGSITVKLIDVAEAGYSAKNNQGEILIKGLPVTASYYKNEEETKGAFNYEEGWFSTGDIGEWLPNGHLKIIDRKKNLVKTQNGEYIALEKLESVYRSNPLVLNICCYADDTKVKPIAIVIPNEANLKKLAVQLKLAKSEDEVHLAEIVNNKKLCNEVTHKLVATGKEQGLAGIELILGCVILDDEWTPENGFVTSAQKLQRKKILNSCKDRVETLYGDS
ncbi:hypothetical protein B5S28_g3635 [[Candida] boidinii]|nr:hypothetical protein B5S28_g3635 [[Candida] boidinii]OWB64182.1 hypothetical protein B5S29_g5232 [[Candida] boidinii]OWB74302.1 hypothetical protein B5S31_g4090 [[Candida] boidinii]